MTPHWTVADMPSQVDRRFLITGANSGVGYRTAVELARRGAVVVLACRSLDRGAQALRELVRDAAGPESAAGRAELVELNLASLASVERVARAELDRHEPLHALINNAGVFAPPRRLTTDDGFELQFGTNVLGHFALTCRLLPALAMGCSSHSEDAARVVTLASIAHKRGRIRFDDLQSERSYHPTTAYAQSKLADLMFALALERRLRARKSGIVSLAAHPGVAETNLFKIGRSQGLARTAEQAIAASVRLLLNSTAQGALPTLFAATADEALGGGYYGPQGWLEMRGGDVGPAQVAPQAADRDAQDRLWEACVRLTGCDLGMTTGSPT